MRHRSVVRSSAVFLSGFKMIRVYDRIVFLVALFALVASTVDYAVAEGRSEIIERWRQHDEQSGMRVNHDLWETFLLNYIRPGEDGVHRIAYGEVSDRNRRLLANYIEAMSKVDVTAYRRAEQLAYWINLHNALMVKLVLDSYPIASIRKLERPGGGKKGSPWTRPLVVIDGLPLSLDDIERDIILSISNDLRVHYAITCPAVDCPNLQPIPFSGLQLDQQLSDAAMAYVNDPRSVSIEGGKLHVSSFYRWHLQEFGGSERAIIEHLMAYADPDLAMSLQSFDRLHGDRFDWRLNDAVR